jgi:hypothetical protein
MSDCECPTFTLHGISTTLVFPKPEWGNPNNEISKNVELFNFKSGDIDTVDRGINAQPLTIGGIVCICGIWGGVCFPLCFPMCFSALMTSWLNDITEAMNNGEIFTINELGSCLNGIYIIGDFTFNTIKGLPECFSWSLSLERVKDV